MMKMDKKWIVLIAVGIAAVALLCVLLLGRGNADADGNPSGNPTSAGNSTGGTSGTETSSTTGSQETGTGNSPEKPSVGLDSTTPTKDSSTTESTSGDKVDINFDDLFK